MNNIKFQSSHKHRFFLEITPMIDMVFLLVAFFLLNSSFEKVNSINIDLPAAENTGLPAESDIVISITALNEIYFNDMRIEFSDLKNKIESFNPGEDKKVIIEGDKAASYDTIITVIDLLGKNGINNFILSAKKK
ncbi:MAG: biopolymer transporter ExbD [Spirochaetes bacterium]|nr:biopolymer transporter ExbD [Spirochaetota bacterium]